MALSEKLNGSQVNIQKHLVNNESFNRMYVAKWKSLKKRGFSKPATFAENKRRAKEAHMR